MAQVNSGRTQLINLLGYKNFTRDGYLVLANEHGKTIGYANMLRFTSTNLFALSNTQIASILFSFQQLLQDVSADAEIISLPYYCTNHQQKTYWNQKLEYDLKQHPSKSLSFKTKLLNNSIKKLKDASDHIRNRIPVLLIYSKDLSTLKHFDNTKNDLLSNLSVESKLHIIQVLSELNLSESRNYRRFVKRHSIRDQIAYLINNYKKPLFNSMYMYNPTTKTCSAFLDLDSIATHKSPIPAFYLSEIMNIPHTVALLAISNDKLKQHPFAIDSINNKENYQYISLHLLVYAPTAKLLENRIKNLRNQYPTIRLIHIMNKSAQKANLKSIFTPISSQTNIKDNHVKLIQNKYLSRAYMVDQDQLKDPNGSLLGYTQTHNEFCFNPFYLHDTHRTRVSSLIMGAPGMGKSMLAKKLCDDALIRNNHVINLDATGEYVDYTRKRHGLVINTADPKNYINMFQLFLTATDANDHIDYKQSYIDNTIRIASIYKYIDPKCNGSNIKGLYDVLDSFYIKLGVITKQGTVTTIDPKEFPTIYDFLHYLTTTQNDSSSELYKATVKLYNIYYRKSYAKTTQLSDLSNDSLVDIYFKPTKYTSYSNRSIQSMRHTELDNKLDDPTSLSSDAPKMSIKIAMLNYLALLSQNSIIHASRSKTQHFYYYINFDDAEQLLDRSNDESLILLKHLMNDWRKDHTAITLVIPSLYDIDAKHDLIEHILTYIQYFHFFNMTCDDIQNLTKIDPELSMWNLDQATNLRQGQVFSTDGSNHHSWYMLQ